MALPLAGLAFAIAGGQRESRPYLLAGSYIALALVGPLSLLYWSRIKAPAHRYSNRHSPASHPPGQPSAATLEILGSALISLGSPDRAARITAIATLEPLTLRAGVPRVSIADALVRFVRSQAQIAQAQEGSTEAHIKREPSEDTLAALNVLGRMRMSPSERNALYDFSELDLRHVQLRNLNFSGANFRGALLDQADISGSRLSGANLRFASLQGIRAVGTSFTGAVMQGADLTRALLILVDFTNAILAEANLTGVFAYNIRMDQAILPEANLTDAKLAVISARDTCFSGAVFNLTNLAGADLRGSDVNRDQLANAYLRNIMLAGGDGNVLSVDS